MTNPKFTIFVTRTVIEEGKHYGQPFFNLEIDNCGCLDGITTFKFSEKEDLERKICALLEVI